jgi:hypothetical protein
MGEFQSKPADVSGHIESIDENSPLDCWICSLDSLVLHGTSRAISCEDRGRNEDKALHQDSFAGGQAMMIES